MARVGVWKSPGGAVFVTPDAIGFGFYRDEEIGKLQVDLESGLSANQAAGFSGNVYPLNRLRRVRVEVRRKRVVVEFRDLVLTGKDTVNFHTEAACREFCDILLDNLGPEWQRATVPNRSFWTTVLAVVVIFIVVGMATAVLDAMVLSPSAGKGAQARSQPSGLFCGGSALVAVVASVACVVYRIKKPSMVDAIVPRK